MSTESNTTASQPRSAEIFERAKHVMPGGVSRNTVLRKPYPPYAAYGEGCRLIDLDGISRIDFSNNMASLIHGHAFAPIVEAVTEQIKRGTAFMMATECEVVHAEHMCSRSPGFQKVRFMNSGTEAVMVSIKASRAFTGRPMIAKVEGAYHWVRLRGWPARRRPGSVDHPNSVPWRMELPVR